MSDTCVTRFTGSTSCTARGRCASRPTASCLPSPRIPVCCLSRRCRSATTCRPRTCGGTPACERYQDGVRLQGPGLVLVTGG
jgi:hypothetical protein